MVEADMYLGCEDVELIKGLLQNPQSLSHHDPSLAQQKPHSRQWLSMVVIKDRDASLNSIISNDNNVNHTGVDCDDDLSVFPPSNHENLFPSCFTLEPPISQSPSTPPSRPVSPSSLSSSSSSSSLPLDFDSSPPPAPSVLPVPRWWAFALEILRSRICRIVSCFRYNDGGGAACKRSVFWSFGNLGLPVLVAVWWLCVRLMRWRRRRERVGHLLQTIREKDEKIIQLLNQIAQMNEVLIARHKALTSG